MNSHEIQNLAQLISKLPGLGPRSARRLVLHLIKNRETMLNHLIQLLEDVRTQVKECTECGNISTSEICEICRNEKRSPKTLCIVRDVADLWALERAQIVSGEYHILGGVLSAIDGITPEDLNIKKLISRIEKHQTNEIIFALPPTIDGQTTMHYIANSLTNQNLKISSLAQGIPLGGELDYLDDGTLTTAFQSRIDLKQAC